MNIGIVMFCTEKQNKQFDETNIMSIAIMFCAETSKNQSIISMLCDGTNKVENSLGKF